LERFQVPASDAERLRAGLLRAGLLPDDLCGAIVVLMAGTVALGAQQAGPLNATGGGAACRRRLGRSAAVVSSYAGVLDGAAPA
jgi:hypothetical protein